MLKYQIILTPYNTLLWKLIQGDTEDNIYPDEVQVDWCQSLFELGANLFQSNSPILSFWQDFSEYFIRALCHIPEGKVDNQPNLDLRIFDVIETPSEEKCQEWFDLAPIMEGGEYLSKNTFLDIWQALISWCNKSLLEFPDFESWLASQAPRWQQVGRITFNLAENKANPQKPFGFMATYTDGLSQSGKIVHIPLGNALQNYAGKKNNAALLKLLFPIQRATELLPWVDEMLLTKEIYKPIAFTAQKAYQLLKDTSVLEQCGIILRLPNWWKQRPRPKAVVKIGDNKPKGLGLDAIVSFNVKIALGDISLTDEDIKFLLNSDDDFIFFKGQWVEIDKQKLQQILDHWNLHQGNTQDGEMNFAKAMRLLSNMPNDNDIDHNSINSSEINQWQQIELGEELQKVMEFFRTPLDQGQPQGLNAVLRPYQRKGFAWLRFLTNMGFGVCLADDMGLGKTLQILALLLDDLNNQKNIAAKPSLLVIPASLLGNWRNEAEKFTPELKFIILHPAEISKNELGHIFENSYNFQNTVNNYQLVITTYTFLTRYTDIFSVQAWHRLILDEAQAIKNSTTKQARAACNILANSRIALTGTPVENRLSDLWSLFNFINPGLLGSAKDFKNLLTNLEKRQSDQYAPLRKLISPYIMRRMKTDKNIIDDLPSKTEMIQYCQLSQQQVKIYQNIISSLKKQLEAVQTEENPIHRQGIVLQTLMRLKQVCNHPSQFAGDMQFNPNESGKFLRLAEICSEIASRQERVLVFTQYQEIIEPLAEYLKTIFKRPGLILHGKINVKKRKELVAQFQEIDGPPFFVISLKAGGTGLNLTAASQVIHFDRWWNPAVEDQATDRAFRIGQKQPVFVHKFVVRGTLEEKIDSMLSEKKNLSNEILGSNNEINITSLDDDALLTMLNLDISRALI